MSTSYGERKKLLAKIQAGETIRRRCRRCGEVFIIFQIEVGIEEFLCIECEWLARDDAQRRVMENILRLRSCGDAASQGCESIGD